MRSAKKLICLALIFLFSFPLIALAAPVKKPAQEGDPPKISAAAACLMDVDTGQIYFDKQGDKRREPASLTKIMTCILAIEKGNLKDVVTVSKKSAAVSMGQDIGLNPGDRLYLEDLLKAALLYSANDSTVAIGEHIGGSHEQFINLMNAKARELEMKNTQYANTNGFHNPNHYTTANDLARLTAYALKNPTFAKLVSTKQATVHWLPKEKDQKNQSAGEIPREREVHNTNALLESNFEGINGVKTGTTPRAGECLIASATRGNRKLVAVILHSRNRWNDATSLLDYGFKEITPVVVAEKDEQLSELPVVDGVDKKVTLVAAKKLEINVLRKDVLKVNKKVTLKPTPVAPVRQGMKLGEITYSLNGQKLAKLDLVANKNIDRLPWYKRIFKKR